MNESTILIHAGEPKRGPGDPVVMPIFQSSMYLYEGIGKNRYIRLSNTPNHLALGEKLAALEGAEAAMVTGSGMAAIIQAVLALVPVGGEVLAQDALYGGAHHFFSQVLPSLGRTARFYPVGQEANLGASITSATKLIYCEAMANPCLQIPDFSALVDAAKRRGVPTLIDATLSSPVNFRPLDVGFDGIIHSATKYLNGHSDVVAGAVLGTRGFVKGAWEWGSILGAPLDPHACFLLQRGIKTLGLRVKHQNESAIRLAASLENHPRIAKVHYPGLPSHPQHVRAKEYFKGCGGLFSFECRGSVEEVDKALARLKLAVIAPSLGGVETLVTRPVTTSHALVPKEDLKRAGITDTLVRVSVGLEDIVDLENDFLEAFSI